MFVTHVFIIVVIQHFSWDTFESKKITRYELNRHSQGSCGGFSRLLLQPWTSSVASFATKYPSLLLRGRLL